MVSTFRSPLLFLSLAFAGLSLGNCSKKDDSEPTNITNPLLTTGTWRLDQIIQDGQVTSSGASIKDRYTLKFVTGGAYTQTLLADNTAYNGTWTLEKSNDFHLTDYKGTKNDYKLDNLTSTELRYSFTNKTNQSEVRVFSAQP
jgi:hypothetical protein